MLVVLAAVQVALPTPPVAAATLTLANAGFEAGNLGGWSVSGGAVSVVTSHSGHAAPEGNHFAVVHAGCPTTTLSQSFTAAAGQTLAGWSFFTSAEGSSSFNDSGQVRIVVTSSGSPVSTLFSSSVAAVGGFGTTPWVYWSHTFESPGTYTLEVRSTNAMDCVVNSVTGLDIQPPLPLPGLDVDSAFLTSYVETGVNP